MDYKEISQSLKQHKISRAALAERVGVCKGTVAQWLCGRRPIPVRKMVIIEGVLHNETHPEFNAISAYAVRLSGREMRRISEKWHVRSTPVAMERLIRRLLLEDAKPVAKNVSPAVQSVREEAPVPEIVHGTPFAGFPQA